MTDVEKRALWPDWETVRLIGHGSYGAVYEIERDILGQKEKAALKMISIPQNESDIEEMYSDGYDEESITNTFQNHLKSIIGEYTLMRKMNGSANVVNCDDVRYVQHDDGFGWDVFIKMELLTPLTRALPKSIPEEMVVCLGRDICRALVLCKKYDIIHRDIKPQNIFLSPNGDYKLGDFGIAKTIERTSSGTKAGTYKYMAPEVYNNQPYHQAADIYSLGLVLYWMLNERRSPFMPLPPQKLMAGMEEEARLRRFKGEQIPAPAHGSPELKRIVLKACAYEQKDRYHSAAEMLAELENIGKPGSQKFIPTPDPGEEGAAEDASDQTDGEHTVTIRPIPVPSHKSHGHAAEKTPKEETSIRFTVVGAKRKDASIKKTNPIVGIGAGWYHTVGLRQDGTVVATGYNIGGQCNVSDWSNIVAISAGMHHTVGLKSDGTVVAVGNNELGQCNVSDWSDIAAVNTGPYHTVGLRKNGTVVAVGENRYGQCDLSDWSDIVAVNAGYFYTVGLKSDGTVVVKGENGFVKSNLSDWRGIVSVSAAFNHTVGLKSRGKVVAVGDNRYGQCNVFGWSDITAICAVRDFTVGLKSDGTVVAVGNNQLGQCNVSGWRNITAVNAGPYHTVGLKADGTVVAVGNEKYGQCDVSDW